MTRRPLVLCLLAAALVAAPSAAHAAPKKGGGGGYSVVHTYDHVRCDTGATCSASGSASRAGALSGSSSYSREQLSDGEQHEAGVGGAVHGVTLAVPAAATAVTVTATWSLDLAVAASSTSGTTYGAVSVRLDVPRCEGSDAPCTATLAPGSVERVRWLYDMPDGLSSSGRDGRQTVTLSMEVEGADLPTSLTVHPDVQGAAGGYPDCVLLVPCLAGKEKPQGTSSSRFSGTLQSVTLAVG